jgi:sulfhydrogenase subunit beta (sulfur reductase)
MNEVGYCTRSDLLAWLDKLANQVDLIAPAEDGGMLYYRQVKSGKKVVLPREKISRESSSHPPAIYRPLLSAKEFFFPSTERLFTIEKRGQEFILEEFVSDDRRVIFGLTPCDARGIWILDQAFLETTPKDIYYAARRENTTLVGMACLEMGETCFCTSMGDAPDDASHVDVMVTPVEGGFEIETITAEGGALLADFPLAMESIQPGSKRSTSWSTKLVTQPKLSPPQSSSWPVLFTSQLWTETAERCISCRACAYVCPTCRCFDLRDETTPGGNGADRFERIRCWDSCTGEPYRRIAGGHNPRASQADRLRNRYFCKFHYFPIQYNLADSSACTGCGRCIDVCPVNIDITEVLAHLAEG